MSRPPPRNFYEILGVSRDAGGDEIALAYERLSEDAKKDSTPPDPEGLAMAKVARDTLMQVSMRAEYDRRLAAIPKPEPAMAKRRSPLLLIGGVAALVVVAIVAAIAFTPRGTPSAAKAPEALPAAKLAAQVIPQAGSVRATLMSGEVRDLGLAIAVGNGEMATTCRGIAPGAQLSVTLGGSTSKAELARANEKLDVCTLRVAAAPAGVKLRAEVPSPGERLHAVTLASKDAMIAVSASRALESPEGAAMEIRAPAALPNGTPIVDAQGRLVAIVTSPHAFGEGVVAALGAGRLAPSPPAAK